MSQSNDKQFEVNWHDSGRAADGTMMAFGAMYGLLWGIVFEGMAALVGWGLWRLWRLM